MNGTITTLTNQYTPETTRATVKKVWDDANDQDGKRPKTLKVTLSNGASVTLNAENQWTATVENLPVYRNGRRIEYTWTEEGLPEGYTLTNTDVNGTVTTLTNQYTPETTEATVKKVWDDQEDRDGIRPEKLKVTLSNGASVTLDAGNRWTATVKDLPVYKDGKKIEYTWTEDALPEGYTLTNTSVEGTVTTLTNTHRPETVEVTVRKVWDDAGNRDGKRPAALKVKLSNGRTVTLSAENGWTATVKDLPKYEKGREIAYSWTEDGLPEGYALTGSRTNGTVTTLTNKHTPETTEATVRKVWDDRGNQDGRRPEELKVTLSNGTTVTLNAGNRWTATVKDLPVYENGRRITYTWTEDGLPEGYTLTGTDVNGTVTTLTNTHVPETTTVTVKKVWDDDDDRDGLRPVSLDVRLSNGTVLTLDQDNDWTATVEDLPVYENGRRIEYAWMEEDLPEGYALTQVDVNGTVTTLTNTHVPGTTAATVQKLWVDGDDRDGLRPDELIVTLKNGDRDVAVVRLNAQNGWMATVTGLPRYEAGREIAYRWVEDLPGGYLLTDTDVKGTVTTLTNTHDPEMTEVTVRKVWNDAGDRDGIRPLTLSVRLSNGMSVTLSAANGWTATLKGLPKYADGREIVYEWMEEDIPEGYALTKVQVNGTVTTLTDTHRPETTRATVKKLWDDANDRAGQRPRSLTVTLSNGTMVTLNDDNHWTATVENLPKYAAGKEILYYWMEEGDMPEGYALTRAEVDGTVTTLTNSYKPETTRATVKKVWDDADDRDGKRPESLTVTLSNGQSVTLNEGNGWTATVEDLPAFDAEGRRIAYEWMEEGDMPEGYALTRVAVNGTITTLTNSYTPETTEVTVKKVWDDWGDQDGIRPEAVTVTLSNGMRVTLNAENRWSATIRDLPKYSKGREIVYEWMEEDIPEGYALTKVRVEGTVTTLTNTHEPETTEVTVRKLWDDMNDRDGLRPEAVTVLLSNGMQVVLNDANGWTATLEDLPRYAAGEPILYEWMEQSLPEGYALTNTDVNGTVTTLTNTHVPETIRIAVKKVWDDDGDRDGLRPAELEVALRGGGLVTTVRLNEANGWTAIVEDLPACEGGNRINYRWVEPETEGYVLTDTAEVGSLTVLTNTHIPETTVATVRKVWEDDDDRDGLRPERLRVMLSNGTEVTLSESNDWTATVEDLPAYENGRRIAYRWMEEELPEGYELTGTSVNGTITTLYNTHAPEEIEVRVRKVWDDEDDRDGLRPERITVKLNTGDEVTLSEENGWEAGIGGLPKYRAGAEIYYAWLEEDLPEGYALTKTVVDGALTTLTNRHVPETTTATVRKVWEDDDDRDGLRPAELEVALRGGGGLVTTVRLNEANGWTATVRDLPVYERGERIEYRWTEEALPEGYRLTDSRVNGTLTTLTNTHVPDTTEATIRKVWDDDSDRDGLRPANLEAVLSNGVRVILNEANHWTAAVKGLPKYENGREIAYTWTEGDLPEGYALTDTSVNGTVTTLTNSHVPETTAMTVRKLWNDDDDRDAKRPAELNVALRGGGGLVRTVTLNAEIGWTATVEDLPVYEGGHRIGYYWAEMEPEGYALTDTVIDGNETTLTNSREPELVAVTVRKAWEDEDDRDGLRPERLEVELLADGETVSTATLSAENHWTCRVEGLPMCRAGERIAYTWREKDLPEGDALTGTVVSGT